MRAFCLKFLLVFVSVNTMIATSHSDEVLTEEPPSPIVNSQPVVETFSYRPRTSLMEATTTSLSPWQENCVIISKASEMNLATGVTVRITASCFARGFGQVRLFQNFWFPISSLTNDALLGTFVNAPYNNLSGFTMTCPNNPKSTDTVVTIVPCIKMPCSTYHQIQMDYGDLGSSGSQCTVNKAQLGWPTGTSGPAKVALPR